MPQGQHSNSNDASKRRREELPINHRLHPKPSRSSRTVCPQLLQHGCESALLRNLHILELLPSFWCDSGALSKEDSSFSLANVQQSLFRTIGV